MRRFTPEYLDRTRRGMWESRDALAGLELDSRSRILDVGCGTGQLTRVLAAESPGATVVGADADADLLRVAREETDPAYCAADAHRLPFPDDSFDLVVCQALLINLPEPVAAVREFARVSSELVAAVEPDNADVSVASTVDSEADLEARVRSAYIAGVDTDVALGERVRQGFLDAGLSGLRTRRYHHEKRVEPPYSEADLESARLKASGGGLSIHESELTSELSPDAYEELRREWRRMGREVVEQMSEGTYERVEVVPFDVTVGRV
ncbi:class I SAM-dependent methyltransferase [Halorarum halobium]|uniref:class I SAM-dependent methyltransferase n=1 Tax=Halorarum halobium TaxID=3075121 RepID=UPI0028A80BEF|nr:class I SAM-dependent methyltransferase [Halobaculum sp. XH14]